MAKKPTPQPPGLHPLDRARLTRDYLTWSGWTRHPALTSKADHAAPPDPPTFTGLFMTGELQPPGNLPPVPIYERWTIDAPAYEPPKTLLANAITEKKS